jgi:hypothetical protein
MLQTIPDFEKEVMFIISQMDFGHYLNQPPWISAAATLPTASQMHSDRDGDFDLLIFHRLLGILVGETKAIGDCPLKNPGRNLIARVTKAVKQLEKEVRVVKHRTSDLSTPPRVLATLMVPNISTVQLQNALASDSQLCEVRVARGHSIMMSRIRRRRMMMTFVMMTESAL